MLSPKILETPGGIKLGGEVRNITVLVSDLRAFHYNEPNPSGMGNGRAPNDQPVPGKDD